MHAPEVRTMQRVSDPMGLRSAETSRIENCSLRGQALALWRTAVVHRVSCKMPKGDSLNATGNADGWRADYRDDCHFLNRLPAVEFG